MSSEFIFYKIKFAFNRFYYFKLFKIFKHRDETPPVSRNVNQNFK